MADNMQSDAIKRFNQMYSNAQPNKKSSSIPEKSVDKKEEVLPPQPTNVKKSDSFLDVLRRDKEKSLILILIVILISEKADTTLILALLYIIL